MPQNSKAPKESKTQKQDFSKNQKIVLTPHDLFFRKVMNNPLAAQEFIQSHFPPSIAALIDSGSLQLTDSSFIDKDLQELRSDILYKALFRGVPGYIHIIIEHQRKADPLMPLRMLEYTLEICRRELAITGGHQLPLVYPCVIYNGAKPYCYTTDIFEMFQDPTIAREIFLKPFTLIDLPSIPDDDLKKRPLIGMLEMHLKHASNTRDTIDFIRKIADLLKVVESMNQLDVILAGAYYLFQTSKDGASRRDIVEELQKHLYPPTQSKIMTIAEAFVEEGRQDGIQKERNTFRSLLIKQLNCRFPNQVTPKYLHLIEEADGDKLSYWIESLMKASTIDEVFSCF